ncbi:MAG: tail fiber domain-containing protein [Actinomycetes bacterium]
MPLCPQITNTPITVTQTSDFTVTSVSPVVPATTADVAVAKDAADAAQSDATAAQATADGKNKIYRQGTTPTGTFAVGDLWFNTSSDNAMSRWDGSSFVATTLGNNALASISANKITAGTIDASVITVSNINAGNIATGTISSIAYNNGSGTFQVTSGGALTASSATITGTINANSGYLGSSSNGWNFSSSGYLTNSGGSTILYPTTTPGGNATTYSVFTDRGVYAERLYITGSQSSAVYSSGGVYAIGTLAGANAAFLVNSSGSITAVVNITQSGTLTGNTGITSSGAITTSGNISTTSSGTITASGNITASAYIYNPGYQVSTAGGAARINDASTPTARLVAASGSSIRFKKDIVDIATIEQLNPKLLLTVPIKAFRYRDDYLDTEDERSGVLVPGFIAEELDAIYPVAVDHDSQGRASRWSSDFIVPGLLALIQDQDARIKALEGK